MSSHNNRKKDRNLEKRAQRSSLNQETRQSIYNYYDGEYYNYYDGEYEEENFSDLAYIEQQNEEDIIQQQINQAFAERDQELAEEQALWKAEGDRLEQEYYDQVERQNVNEGLLDWLQCVEDEKNIDNFLNGSDEDPTM